jgi:hypothetical protein
MEEKNNTGAATDPQTVDVMLTITNDPDPADQVTTINFFEHAGENYNPVGSATLPDKSVTLTGVTMGLHAYAATFCNTSGDGPYSQDALLLPLPGSVPVLVVSIP